MSDHVTTLVNTLMNSGLASSHSEAVRMANDMLGTVDKVNQDTKKPPHYMIKNYTGNTREEGREIEKAAQLESVPTESVQSEPKSAGMQSKIDELRNSALNPQPVDVQVDFDTPKRQIPEPVLQADPTLDSTPNPAPDSTPEPMHEEPAVQPAPSLDTSFPGTSAPQQSPSPESQVPQNENLDDIFSQNNAPTTDWTQEETTPPNTTPQAAPESYSAGDFAGKSLNEMNDDFLAVKPETPSVASQPENQAPQTEVQQPEVQQPELPASVEQSPDNVPVENKRNPTWTEEDKKLQQDVDITKIFNVNK